MSAENRRILIAGGGPVGLLCAWLIGRRRIPVRLFDNNRGPRADPRAATTHPATLDLLTEDGLAADLARVGLVAPIFQFWDRPSAELVAQFDHALHVIFFVLVALSFVVIAIGLMLPKGRGIRMTEGG